MKHWTIRLRTAAAWIVLALILCQFVPLGRFDQNLTSAEAIPKEVRVVLAAHCFQCHSEQTDWPKTAYLAPLSWYVTGKVRKGRNALNFTNYDVLTDTARTKLRSDVARFIESTDLSTHGRIPGFPKLRMTERERQTLIEWNPNNHS